MVTKHVIEKLSLYIDGALTPKEKTSVDEHLKQCQSCRQELAFLQKTVSVVSQWQAPSPDPDFEQQVKERIFDYEMKKEEAAMNPRWRLSSFGIPAPAIAGIIIFLIAGGLLSTQLYMSRSIQGRVRDGVDKIGEEYRTYAYDARRTVDKEWAGSIGYGGNMSIEQSKEVDRINRNRIDKNEYGVVRGGYVDNKKTKVATATNPYAYFPSGDVAGKTINGFSANTSYDTGTMLNLAQGSSGAMLRSEIGTSELLGEDEERSIGTAPVIVIQPILPAAGEGERVIRTAQMTLEVDDGQKTYSKLSALCEEMGGFLAHSNFYKDKNGTPSGVVTLRIPKDKFNAALEKIKELGKVERINTESQDVGREYADLESRLKTAMIVYDKMMKAMEGRKVTIPEAMRLESELTPITNRIETIKAEIEKLNNLTSFTTITVQFYESKISAAVIKENVHKAKENIVVYLLGALHFIVAALPTLLALVALGGIGLAILLFVKRKISAYLRNKK